MSKTKPNQTKSKKEPYPLEVKSHQNYLIIHMSKQKYEYRVGIVLF